MPTKKLSETEIDKIYKNWGKQRATKIHITDSQGRGESVWGLVVGDGLVAINNVPLMDDYRWQDIVTGGGSRPSIVHRRWHTRLWFNYDAAEDEKGDLERRKAIFNALKPVGHVGFMWKGLAYILMEMKKTKATAAFKKASKTVPHYKGMAAQ